ncbi:linker for activation of T-cells family member 2 isoform X11 [Heterocephalus glaber]|uniref:Linker for activation of T-cells family member 2 isoform X11 n=1 Tax=Heterocephalus glaber TaxID=10181 RepID=A0AAX6SMN9_HETGA|nr:linker for activation of T-cells family member 2 isoform X11 [Heterocephalus glaber]
MAARDVSGLRSPCICGLLLSPPRRACPAADVRDDSVVTGSCRLACCPPEATAPAAGAVRGWGVLSEEPAQATTVLQAGTAEDMGPEVELLWPGSALLLLLLLLLGAVAVAGLCVHCSRPGPKRTEKIYEQRNLQERQQSFSVASRTYSSIRQAWPGPLTDTAPAGKDKLLHFSTLLEDPASPRYQNFSKETPLLQTITTGAAPGSPSKMRTTPTPTRTCSSVSLGAGAQSQQAERSLGTIRTQHPSSSCRSPHGPQLNSPDLTKSRAGTRLSSRALARCLGSLPCTSIHLSIHPSISKSLKGRSQDLAHQPPAQGFPNCSP